MNLAFIFQVLIFPGFAFILLFTVICDWIERKVEARMQNRIGPFYTGPAGVLQPIADFIKLLTKEDIVPRDVKNFIFGLSPILALTMFVFAFLFLPVQSLNSVFGSGFEGDLIVILALASIANFFLFLSGWASTNPYSAISAARILTQFIGYDVPLFFLVLAPAFMAGHLKISSIISAQRIPFVILIPWAFILFILTLQAELEKDPFDVPNAESELVGGYETEYAGRRLAFLKLAKDVQVVFGAALAVELFLGGPAGPVFFGPPAFWYTIWFTLKLLVIIFISEYLTCVLARLRIDQVLNANWKVLLPLAILSLISAIAIRMWVFPLLGWA
ncbi:MAG: NADH-quinone oxidoreductase subunit H [Candidatus Bathyarchaeota archaeon]|nr:NADH-quinone oxidoreductase subunit H [Candidatus Bathyarchaeota archaeon]MCX8177700.1 NADH-quinone oxidoreductase subunit H [Candidatus Bathyarchaeota archaeon]MDW8193960.1 complex I subunit 1 family protein [Nitrososphaerota archaeon]